MTRAGRALLEFDPALNGKKSLADGLSGALRIGNTLWVANDETVSVERLAYQGRDAEGVHRYGGHVQFALHDYLRLPVPAPPDEKEIDEADVEGLDYRNGYLWLIGSHSLKRKKPQEGESPQKNLKRLEKVISDGNRFLLSRIPLVEEDGTQTLRRKAEVEGRTLTAAQLRGDEQGNDLTRALSRDQHLQSFITIPGKENGLDFEGLAAVGNRLFIGLRGPVLRGWAIILEVEPEEDPGDPSTLQLKSMAPGDCPYRKHFLQLGGMGIRDLCVRGADLLILAGPTMDIDGPVTVFRWPEGAQPKEESCVVFAESLETLLDIPNDGEEKGKDHAEGMTLIAPEAGSKEALLVVYDSAAASRKSGNNRVEADIFSI